MVSKQCPQVAKKPKRGDRIPKKGKMVKGKFVKLQSFGTLRGELTDSLYPAPHSLTPQPATVSKVCSERPRAQTCGTSPFGVLGTASIRWMMINALIWIWWATYTWQFDSQLQDFSTQIHYWREYRDECDRLGLPYGRHVTAACAEHIAGRGPNQWANDINKLDMI